MEFDSFMKHRAAKPAMIGFKKTRKKNSDNLEKQFLESKSIREDQIQTDRSRRLPKLKEINITNETSTSFSTDINHRIFSPSSTFYNRYWHPLLLESSYWLQEGSRWLAHLKKEIEPTEIKWWTRLFHLHLLITWCSLSLRPLQSLLKVQLIIYLPLRRECLWKENFPNHSSLREKRQIFCRVVESISNRLKIGHLILLVSFGFKLLSRKEWPKSLLIIMST